MRVLVTGSAGFVGYHLCRRLLAEGHTVTGYDGMTAYYDVALKQARLARLEADPAFTQVTAMLEDAETLDRTGDAVRPDVIVHLAAQAGVRYSLENPRAYVDSNLIGSWNVLALASRVKPQHLLLASTSSIYGANAKVPFAEMDRADEPLTLYAASKKAMEAMAHSSAHLYSVPTTAFRFFTVYGPWGRPDMALFKFTRAILAGDPVEIYGEGRMQRDFTYVEDLVEAIVRLMAVPPHETTRIDAAGGRGAVDSLSPVAPFRVVNIGGGQPVGLMDFVETIERSVGRPAIRKMLPMQLGDVPRTFADPSLLQALTGYTPATALADGVEAFVAWFREYAGA